MRCAAPRRLGAALAARRRAASRAGGGALPAAARWRERDAAWGQGGESTSVFGAWAGDYDVHRPSYPGKAFDAVLAAAGGALRGASPRVIDVGCGSGRAALALAARGAKVTAVDPDASMLEQLRAALAGQPDAVREAVAVADATRAEELCKGLPPEAVGTLDAVCAFQAAHWFSPLDGFLRECKALLRPGGLLALAWNDRRLEEEWVVELEGLIEKHNPEYNRAVKQNDGWDTLVASTGLFVKESPASLLEFTHEVRYSDAEGLVALLDTYSYVRRALSEEQRSELHEEARELVRTHFGGESFSMPYVTKLFLLRAVNE